MSKHNKIRVSCPLTARRLWGAIYTVHEQRQVANIHRITKYMNRKYSMTENEVIKQLKLCIVDKLILTGTSFGVRGSKRGYLQKCYSIPHRQNNSNHDWYCFECHHAGRDIMKCSSCHRVYHNKCVGRIANIKHFVCDVCSSTNDLSHPNKGKLHYVLKNLCNSIKSLCPEPFLAWKDDNFNYLPCNLIIFKCMDFSVIQKKLLSLEYKNVLEFQFDVQNILHNSVIYYGDKSGFTKQAQKMFDMCAQTVKEIKLCPDCFRASYEKKGKFWFCVPCKHPHKLVYAQVKGFPYWPAKVMEETQTHVDVRFFGGHHQRGLVEKDHVLPITANLDAIQKKPKSTSWERACNELKCHQSMLENNSHLKLKCEQKCAKPNIRKRIISEGPQSNHDEITASVVKKNRLTDDEKLSANTLYPNILPRGPDSVEYDKVTQCPSMSFNLKTSGTQTYCNNHYHHRYHVSDSGQKGEHGNENYPNSEFADENYSVLMEIDQSSDDSPPSNVPSNCETSTKVKIHDVRNSNCPLNQRKNFCGLNCNVEKEKLKRIETAIREVNEKYDKIVSQLARKHMKIIHLIKEKRWCSYCNREASIHCCWNTEYCSEHCQDKHWVEGHGEACSGL